jgi:hypothetical protein
MLEHVKQNMLGLKQKPTNASARFSAVVGGRLLFGSFRICCCVSCWDFSSTPVIVDEGTSAG